MPGVFRFGVSAQSGEVSPYFKVTTSARGDVYAICSAMGETLHMSLHESRQYWHMRHDSPSGIERLRIDPLEVVPSITRAFTVTVAGQAAHLPRPERNVVWIGRDEDDLSVGVAFHFFVQSPFDGAILDWPGMDGVTLVGRLPLADFGTITVTAQHRELPPPAILWFVPSDDEDREHAAADFGNPDAFILLHVTVGEATEFILAPGSMFLPPDSLPL